MINLATFGGYTCKSSVDTNSIFNISHNLIILL